MRSPLVLVAAGIVLTVLFCSPAAAADDTSSRQVLEIRQAHLAWTALEKEIEMRTAVTYCGTLYGADTGALERYLGDFRSEEAGIAAAASGEDLDLLIARMRNTTGQFRVAAFSVMTKGQGDWKELTRQISDAKENNPYIQEKKDTYWAVRKAGHLAGFDAWVQEGQQALDILKAGGYDTTRAQRALDVFSSKRPEVLAALAPRSEAAILAEDQQIRPLAEAFARNLSSTTAQVPDTVRFQFYIEQADRAIADADKANLALVPILIDIGDADPLVSKAKTDLASARNLLGTGNLGTTRTPLKHLQKDFTDLAAAYRGIRSSTPLPPDLAADLSSLALRLDNTAGQMGASL